jgi:hypothetical protein
VRPAVFGHFPGSVIQLDTLLAMDWLKLVIGPAVGACLAGVITLMVALVGPGTLRGWRLKKLVELIDALDGDRFPRQRAILLDKADRLASELAARYRIPTQWKVLVSCSLTIGAASGSGFVSGYIWCVGCDTHRSSSYLCLTNIRGQYGCVQLPLEFGLVHQISSRRLHSARVAGFLCASAPPPCALGQVVA